MYTKYGTEAPRQNSTDVDDDGTAPIDAHPERSQRYIEDGMSGHWAVYEP